MGDGGNSQYAGTSTVTNNPTHNYLSIGNWNPTLIVTDSLGKTATKTLYLASDIKKPSISNFNCVTPFTRTTATGYITCTFKISSVDGSNIWYSLDWNGDGTPEFSAPSQGYMSGQTHTQSKACSTATCSSADLPVTLNARTIGVNQWWADAQVKSVVVN